MKRSFLAFSLLALFPTANPVLAQRDAPVWNCYLPGIALHDERLEFELDLAFCKGGGPHEHDEQQMYILGYLDKDEARIQELSRDKSLTNKEEKGKLLLEVLEDEGLVSVLDVKVAKREPDPEPGEDADPRIHGGTLYRFGFRFENGPLFDAIKKLKNFDPANFVDSDNRYFNDKIKLMVFVPVNDCRYADKIRRELRETHDFAHFMDWETILLYFKPLPYRLQFKTLDKDGSVLVYID